MLGEKQMSRTACFYRVVFFICCFAFSISVFPANGSSTMVSDAQEHKPIPVVMFKINDEEFKVDQYVQFLQANQKLVASATSTDEGKAAAVREMAATYLLREAMFKEGLLKKGVEPSRTEVMKAYEELAKRHFPVPPKPEEKQAYQYYLVHQGKYGIPEMIRLNQILLKLPKGVDNAVKETIKKRAESILERLRGGESFKELASSISENAIGKAAQGDIGFVSLEGKPWLKERIEGKQPNEIIGVVESPDGFEILQITDRRPALISPFANVHDNVIKEMQEDEQGRMRAAYVKELSKDVKWEIVEPTLKPIIGGVLFP